MAKKIYIATYEGLEVDRSTDRTYTHMVALYTVTSGVKNLYSMSWCGRYDLALKELSKWQSSRKLINNDKFIILPVSIKEKKVRGSKC